MTKSINGVTASTAHSYTVLGYKDYIGARCLLRDGHLYQGAVLASTAVEKYLKAVLLIFGEKGHGHLDKPGLWKLFQSSGTDLISVLNHEFIQFLGKAYRLRYVDDIKSDIGIAIEQYKVLAELDFSISQIASRLTIKIGDESSHISSYRTWQSAGETALYADNYVLLGSSKDLFVQRKQKFQAVYVTKDLLVYEFKHEALKPYNDGMFSKPELALDGNKMSISFSGPAEEMLK